ncbi:MAG: succinate dehydrogenase, hydrophobic membrane anchor protein [Alphaproteobacteria bacterium]|jgi:succinate dehydrogenase / fumarate reductase membrane anchor subunit|nr:succinate dehydrogenase, hydrophobic membrane anchor protein [Alphaproteobacteria bacterium]
MSRLARARGLGAAKEGVQHWWLQRVTAVALVPLLLWFTASLAQLAGAEHAAVVAWLSLPLVAVLVSLLLFAAFLHLKLGLEVVIEDYVHGAFAKHASLLLAGYGCILLGAIAIFSVLKIAI